MINCYSHYFNHCIGKYQCHTMNLTIKIMDASVVNFKSGEQHKCQSSMIQGLFNLQKCKVLDSIVVRIECWFVGSYDPTSHGTSTVLRLCSCLLLLCFPLFALFFLCFHCFNACFLYFLCFFSWFLCISSIFSPTYRVCVPSPADRSYLGSQS